MLIFTVPPADGLVVTPGLMTFIIPQYFDTPFLLLDIGKSLAKASELSSKIKLAYKFYSRVAKLIENYTIKEFNITKAVNEVHDEFAINPGGLVLIVIPDDYELKAHRKLADAWLNSSEAKVIESMFKNLGYDVWYALVIRRVISDLITRRVDLSPFMKYIN